MLRFYQGQKFLYFTILTSFVFFGYGFSCRKAIDKAYNKFVGYQWLIQWSTSITNLRFNTKDSVEIGGKTVGEYQVVGDGNTIEFHIDSRGQLFENYYHGNLILNEVNQRLEIRGTVYIDSDYSTYAFPAEFKCI